MLKTFTKYHNDGFETTLYDNRKKVMVIVMHECEGRNIWELLVPHDYFGKPALQCQKVAFTKITNTKHEVLGKKAEKRIIELYTNK